MVGVRKLRFLFLCSRMIKSDESFENCVPYPIGNKHLCVQLYGI